jgi:glycosyltransferase involved in cell wall biosynthesis
MRIAFIGTRGVPARYGGFETCAEEIGKRLVKRGHGVTVYGRAGYYRNKPAEYLGMRPIYLPALNVRFLETLSNTLMALIHAAVWGRFDVLLVFNCANSPLLVIPKLFGRKSALHADGLEWMRGKWGGAGKRYFRWAEWIATKLAKDMIADSREIQKYYKERYGKNMQYISYGADLRTSKDPSILQRYGLQPGGYFLQITRFEPENNPLLTTQAFEKLHTDKRLVLVGGAKYPTDYSRSVIASKDPRLDFLGPIYDRNILDELLCNCHAYVHGNEVGGTNPALLEAMAAGCYVICRDVPFNREVLEDAGLYFQKDVGDLAEKMTWSLRNPPQTTAGREKARKIVRDRFDWNRAVGEYERLFQTVGR